MESSLLFVKNLLNLPLLCFLLGGAISLFLKLPDRAFSVSRLQLPSKISSILTVLILFIVGFKGGAPICNYSSETSFPFFGILGSLILWGLLSPLLSFTLLRRTTEVDSLTAAAVAASFGSVSVMTFIAAISFLDQMNLPYEPLLVAVLAVMELPGLISGLYLAKRSQSGVSRKVLVELFFNKAIVSIVAGLGCGILAHHFPIDWLGALLLGSFKPALCLFLFDMGIKVGLQKEQFRLFTWKLNAFAVYTPLMGALFGLSLSHFFGLEAPSATLVAVLSASASYIAVPAAMKIVLPQAQEAIYLPLSLGIAFPFNVIFGIPLYYLLANQIGFR